jgi:inosose dehydratase
MLTDDGKHLYVSWDEYHMLIERLALKIDASGWEFDQILCLARGGMRPGDVLSRVFDKPLAIMSTSSYRADAGTVQGQIDTPVSKRPKFSSDAQWLAYAERLNAFGEHLLKTYDIKLAYHHHMGAYVESPQDIARLMAETNPTCVGLLFDTGHAFYGGAADPAALLKKHVERVVHVHCKDVRPQVIAQARNEGWSFLTGVLNGIFTVPGDGVIDYGAVLGTLHAAGYQGWLVVEAEQDPAVAPSYTYAKKGYETLRRLVDGLGAPR